MIEFPFSDYIIILMLAFLTFGPIFDLSFKQFAFLTHFMKSFDIVKISAKKKIICDSGSVNM